MSIHDQLRKITARADLKISRAANEIMNETKERLKEAVDKLWYSTYTSLDYTRTYELIEAVNGIIKKNKQGDYTIDVFIDDTLMTSKSNTRGWGTHSGFDGGDFRKGLIDSIINGMSGSPNNPRLGDSAPVYEVVQKEAQSYANRILKKYL